MTDHEESSTSNPDRSTQPIHRPRRAPAGTGAGWISLFAWLGFLGLFVAVGRTDVDPRVANPNVEGRPRPVEFLTGFDHWQVIPQIGALIMVVVLTIVFIRGWRKNPGSPVMLMFLCHDADRVAGPDHELGAVRGVQPRRCCTGRNPGRWS